MPIYEYICATCKNRSSVFVKSVHSTVEPLCSSCGGRDLNRAVSGFAYHKSEQTVLEEAGQPQFNSTSDDYYKDPRNIGRWAEKRLGELGVEMPQQAKQMIDAARQGEMPPPLKDI